MSRVFAITGASGVLGSAVATAVVAQGCRVALIDHVRHTPHGLVDGDDVLMIWLGGATEQARWPKLASLLPAHFVIEDVLLHQHHHGLPRSQPRCPGRATDRATSCRRSAQA